MILVIPPGDERPSAIAAHNRRTFSIHRAVAGLGSAALCAGACLLYPSFNWLICAILFVPVTSFAIISDYRHWICDSGGGGWGRYLWSRLIAWWW